jgi:hypothetical protein
MRATCQQPIKMARLFGVFSPSFSSSSGSEFDYENEDDDEDEISGDERRGHVIRR